MSPRAAAATTATTATTAAEVAGTAGRLTVISGSKSSREPTSTEWSYGQWVFMVSLAVKAIKAMQKAGGSPLGAPAGAALVLVLIGQTLQPGGHLLLGLHQDVQQSISGPFGVNLTQHGQQESSSLSRALTAQGEKHHVALSQSRQKGLTEVYRSH
ncbi:hypothetical protein CRUP_018843 [Coryphaenoides rupestris]|nr:hypothetical protein CRUP_018843 [Coryphaenoides rupestris]